MREILNSHREKINNSKILNQLNIKSKKYILSSIHREENLDIDDNFKSILDSISLISKKYKLPVIFSTHPRTRKKIKNLNLDNANINFIKPLGFFDYVHLQKNAFITLSDSGTLSEESAILNFPAVIVRTSTERPEAIEFGNVILGNIDQNNIENAIEITVKSHNESDKFKIPKSYSGTNISTKIVKIIQGYTSKINQETWKK